MLTEQKKQKREQMVAYMRQVAAQENQKNNVNQVKLEDFLENTSHPRLLYVLKESIGDIINCTATLKGLKESYPNHDIYFATDPQYFDLVLGLPQIFKVIPYMPIFDSELQMTGVGSHKGYFDVFIHPAVSTQKFLHYLSNNNLSLKLS